MDSDTVADTGGTPDNVLDDERLDRVLKLLVEPSRLQGVGTIEDVPTCLLVAPLPRRRRVTLEAMIAERRRSFERHAIDAVRVWYRTKKGTHAAYLVSAEIETPTGRISSGVEVAAWRAKGYPESPARVLFETSIRPDDFFVWNNVLFSRAGRIVGVSGRGEIRRFFLSPIHAEDVPVFVALGVPILLEPPRL